MKPVFYHIIVGLLFLLIPLSGIGLLRTMVTDQYQVEHAKTFLEIDTKKIDSLEKSVNRQQLLMIGIAIIGLTSVI